MRQEQQENGYGTLEIRLSVDGGSPSTKAQVTAEKRMNNVTLFIFDNNTGTLERVVSSSETGNGSISLSEQFKCGSKTIWAYANYDVDPAMGASLQSHPIPGEGLADNSFADGSFAMRGQCSAFVAGNGVSTASIVLTRTVCRTVIKSIRNSLPGSLPLEIQGAFLADVYTADSPGTTYPAAPYWTNRWGRGGDFAPVCGANAGYEGLTCWFGTALNIANGSTSTLTLPTSEKGPRLYYMPNTVTTDMNDAYIPGAGWTPRLTKLVIVARISGNTCYYTIPIQPSQANESTEYTITVYSVGSDDPEIPGPASSYTLNRMVKPWDSGATYTDNSTPEYSTGVITPQAGHTQACHVAQRMYLQMPVSDQSAEVRNAISFTASLTASDGSVTDATSWLSAHYESGNQLWKLDIACRAAGELEIRAIYHGNTIASTTRSILVPVLKAEVEPLLITGSGKAIVCSWYASDGTTTDGSFFDSSLFSSLLDGGSVEFDTSFPGRSLLGTYTSGGNRYLRVTNLDGMEGLIRGANAEESFAARSMPLIARFRITTPCGIKSAWTQVRICNWWANFYGAGELAEFTYMDNDCYNADIDLIEIADNMGYPSPQLSWKWVQRWGYNFGCGNAQPMAGASQRVAVSSGKLMINNFSSAMKCNAAGMSQISAAFTNSVSSQTLELPCMDVRICKKFYFRSSVNSSWEIIYEAPDVSAFAADIPASPVKTPLWSDEALNRGAVVHGNGNRYGKVNAAYRTSLAECSQWFSSAEAFTGSSYGAGPEDKKHFVFFYTFEPSNE